MPLNSVQLYVRNLLQDLPSPQLPLAQSWVAPPNPGDAGAAPQIYVWGSSLQERRLTMPRSSAQRRLDWQLDLYLQYAVNTTAIIDPTDPRLDTAFPAFVDAVMMALRKVSLPVTITDTIAQPHVISTVELIGEDMRLQYNTPYAADDQRTTWFMGARVTVSVFELLQA